MNKVSIIGCGFVADLYMRSLQTFPQIEVVAAYDHDHARLAAFCAYWNVVPAASASAMFEELPPGSIVLNLTNPDAHYTLNKATLLAGHHVYSEKPLAMQVDHAQELAALADGAGLLLASAPCSVLGQATGFGGRCQARSGGQTTPDLRRAG